MIRNADMRSKDYGKLKDLMRPGHADYPGFIRYNGFNDYRGGGSFSGRITAPLVFAGAVCQQVLESKGINIGAHVKSIENVEDKSFYDVELSRELLGELKTKELPLLIQEKEEEMRDTILKAKKEQDSVGGTIECTVIGINGNR